MANDSRIGILIEAKANAAAIGQTRSELAGLDRAAGQAAGGMSSLSGALGIAGFVALGAAVTATAGAIFNLAESAAQVQRTRVAFDGLAASVGQSSDEMLSAMQAASDGMISNADLVQSANRAMLLGVADSGEKLGQLLEVARVRGAAMGLSVSQAFNDLVTGLGRMSPLILDNLGIVTGGEAVFNNYAASLGRTADSLTDAERKQALFNKVVSETNDLIARQGDAAQQDLAAPFERMSASIANAKQALGELFGPAVAAVAQTIADAANAAVGAVESLGVGQIIGDIRGLENALSHLREGKEQLEGDRGTQFFDQAALDRQNGLIAEVTARLGEAHAQLQIATGSAADFGNGVRGIVDAVGQASPALQTFGNRTGIMSDHLRDGAAAALEMRNAINELAASASGRLSSVFSGASDLLGGGAAAFGQFQQANSELQDRIELWKQAGKSADEVGFLVDGWIRQQSDSFSAQRANLREAERGATSYGSTLSTAASDAASEFDDLKSKVAGVLQGAFADTAGVDVAGLLPREDAVAENARRLADIAVNGFKGQDWLGEFASAVPDVFKIISESGDPKAAAANVLKDFQDGLVPELIDKGRAKDLVRRMILGEQQADALAAEIAAELAAEFGAGAPADLNALVSQALGTGASGAGAGTEGGAQAGADAATSFAQSFATAASGVGAQIAASLKADSVIALIKDAGKAAGEGWGDMFLGVVGDHVPTALVELLTNLVTPGVQAQLAQQASLTGAR